MSHPGPIPDAGLSRRSALKLLAANVALIAASCGKPAEEIVPYVRMPERVLPGVPLEFATTLPLGGYGRGVLCTSVEGRPIKVSGNPSHPMSLGATDVFAEACVYSLYDPDRSQAVRRDGQVVAWTALQRELIPRFATWAADGGRGLRILTGPLTSPTALRQIGALRRQHPGMGWHVSDPLADVSGDAGARLAFGRPSTMLPRWADVDVLASFGADPLGPGPAQIRDARGFSDRRRVRAGTASTLRFYAFECVPTLSGASADHRFELPLTQVEGAMVALARALGADLPDPGLPAPAAAAVEALGHDVQAHPGRALVLAGPHLRPEFHALAHWIGGRVGAPVEHVEPAAPEAGTLGDLIRDLEAGSVDTLLVAGCNPAYDAPPDLHLPDAVKKAGLSIHLGPMTDETAQACSWHVPESHPLESWSDLRGVDGTASLVQPLIRPLYDTRTLHGMLAALGGDFDADDYALVRDTWRPSAMGDFDAWWRGALESGVLPGSAAARLDPPAPALPKLPPAVAPSAYTLCLAPDPGLWDGAFSNNAWLQECPKPLTKEVWGNSLGLCDADADKLGVRDGDIVTIASEGRTLDAAVRIVPGHAPGHLGLALGYGRTRAGTIGTGVGSNGFALVARDGRSTLSVEVRKAAGRGRIHATQEQFALDGAEHELYPVRTLADVARPKPDAHDAPVPSLLPNHDYTGAAARWAMVIDAGACIGCNACVVACQVENNVPVVGPDEIDRHRDMHWLRVDRYAYSGDGRGGFQPVPCMHCETAPCEPVCPVAASVHDSEGLNVQVYNRCIGTRFCEANCPYKVRRFNFFGYADGQAFGDLGHDPMKARYNPNVTVRAQGVMEKCTYCVQRISGARRAAEKENRPLGDADVVTACQSACPTRAISFGNLNAPDSEVGRLRREPHHYALLDHLNTKPRTTYLAKVRNPNPEIAGQSG